MRLRWLRMIDWNIVFTIVTATATIAAAAAAIYTARAVIWQTRTTVGNQAILQLLGFWQSDPALEEARQRNPFIILEKKKRADDISDAEMAYIDDVLDFFDTVGFLTSSRVLDPEAAYQTFFEPMANYWVLHRKYIRAEQEHRPVWKEYSQLMERLFTKEREPTEEEAGDFIRNELVRCKKER
jgi:hypothetical protein